MEDAAILLERFNRSWKGLDRVYHDIARHSGLSDCAFWILYALLDADATILQNDLSQAWLYSRQTASSTLRQLEERGLVTTAYVTGSRRDKAITLTSEGKAFADTYVAPAMEAEKHALTALGADDRDRMLAAIDRYVGLLTETVRDTCTSPTAHIDADQLAADDPMDDSQPITEDHVAPLPGDRNSGR